MPDQSYYWTPEWQAAENAAAVEFHAGEGRVFDNPADAVRWLSEDAETVRTHPEGQDMADGRGKQPSKNKPSTGTSKDKRLSGNGGKKPGPKPKGQR